MSKLIRTIHPQVRILDAERGICSYVASSETVDSYREVIRADGWRFNAFSKNAPFVDSHNYTSIDRLLGRVIDCEVQGRKLVTTVQWAIGVGNELAELGWRLTKGDFLKAVSVGFSPVRYMTPTSADSTKWAAQLEDLGLDEDCRVQCIYLEQELLELSACIIGANPDALLQAKQAGALSAKDIAFIQQRSGRAPESISLQTRNSESKTQNMKQKREQLLAAFGQMTSSTKQTFETLRRAQFGDSDAELVRALHLALRALAAEERMAFGDPVQRICADPERRLFLNAMARKLMRAPLSEAHKAVFKGMGEDSAPGQYYIVETFAQEIYGLLAQYGAWSTLGVRPVNSQKAKFPIQTAYPEAYFVSQGDMIGDDVAFSGYSTTQDTETIACLVNASLALVEDAEADLAPLLLENFMEAFNKRLDTAVFVGNGTNDANNGGITGLFSDATIPTVYAGVGNTTLQQCGADDFISVMESVSPAALQRPCRWWVASGLLPALLRVKDLAGRPLLKMPPEADGFYLLGFPVTLTAVAPAVNQADSKLMAFGEPRGYAVALRNWFNFDSSDHRTWNTLQRSFRAYGRARGILRAKEALAILRSARQ